MDTNELTTNVVSVVENRSREVCICRMDINNVRPLCESKSQVMNVRGNYVDERIRCVSYQRYTRVRGNIEHALWIIP